MKCLVYYLIYNLRILIYINSEYDSLRYISILLLMRSLHDYEIGDNDDEITRTDNEKAVYRRQSRNGARESAFTHKETRSIKVGTKKWTFVRVTKKFFVFVCVCVWLWWPFVSF